MGNLSWSTDEDSLKQAFSRFGQVINATVIRDRDTGRSRGFGFVEFSTAEQARSAIELNEAELDGRIIKVNLNNDHGTGGSGSGGYGGGGYGYGGKQEKGY